MVKSFLKVTSRGYVNWRPRGVNLQKPGLISQESNVAFLNSLPNILDKTLADRVKSDEIAERIKRITEHLMSDGQTMRAMLALHSYNTIEKQQNITEESLYHMRVLAWAVEMIHSYMIIVADIDAGAQTRRGKTCWHLLPDVGMQAFNDASLFRSFLYLVLEHNFLGKPSYKDVRHLFDKAFLYASMGQHLDHKTCKTRNNSFDNFTLDRYNTIVDYKTSYYTFKLPIHLAMTQVGSVDKDALKHMDSICTDIGRLEQIKRDYHDCYGNESGSDIQKGKCTWLVVSALQRCSQPQRIVLSACYGSYETAHIERVKRIYDLLHLPQLYEEKERDISKGIVRKAKDLEMNAAIPSQLFLKLLDMIKTR